MIYDGDQDSLARSLSPRVFPFFAIFTLLEIEHKNEDEDSLLTMTFLYFRNELFLYIIHDSFLELFLVILAMEM